MQAPHVALVSVYPGAKNPIWVDRVVDRVSESLNEIPNTLKWHRSKGLLLVDVAAVISAAMRVRPAQVARELELRSSDCAGVEASVCSPPCQLE